ncbi:MAG: uracil-DNA glycosylase [Candidatus Hydrogenedentes bacterium]|nr:uracil-DNA glycosylase [Candidatus Hydrogenedentota bacterium]
MKEDLADIVALTRKFLEEELRRGTETVNVDPEIVARLSKTARPAGGKLSPLELVEREALQCVKCVLHETRTNVVFGEGNPEARLLFVGEAPGGDEDVQGRPFVGRAGQLLTRIIESIDLTREKVYIANVLKCRPPKNRNPADDEIVCCLPYLVRQIEIIQPQIICALGAFAAQTLVGSTEGIGKLRGKFYDYHGIKLMPTYHPAACLRNPNNKKYVWEDMKRIREEYFGR